MDFVAAESVCPLEIRRAIIEMERCMRFCDNPILEVISEPLGIFLIEADKEKPLRKRKKAA
jgi:hypothetical protein